MLKFLLPYFKRFRFNKISVGVLRPYFETSLTYGMQVDQNRVKKIRAVDGGQMECSGSVAFQVIYEGQKTDVLALVTPALQDEVLLSWRTLQRLDVIPKDFPRRQRMNTMAQRSEVESRAVSSPKEISKEIPKETLKEIPEETLKEIPKETLKEISKEIPKETFKEISKEIPKEISKENQNELSKSIEALIEEIKSVFNTGEQLKTMSGTLSRLCYGDGTRIMHQ